MVKLLEKVIQTFASLGGHYTNGYLSKEDFLFFHQVKNTIFQNKENNL